MRTDDELTREEARELLDRATERANRARRRTRVARGAEATLAVALIVGALVWSFGSLLGFRQRVPAVEPTPTQTAESTYDVTFLGFDEGDGASPGAVVANVRFSWSGQTFPGIRVCELRLLDADGEVIGGREIRVASVDPAHPWEIGEEMPANGTPDTVEGSCGPRLDIGDPYRYSLSNTWVLLDGGVIRATMDTHWEGGGTPGVVRCRFTAIDPKGTVLAQDRAIESPYPGAGLAWDIRLDRVPQAPVPSDPKNVFIDTACVPYVDGNETFPPLQTSARPTSVSYDYTSPPGIGWTYSDVVFRYGQDGWEADFQMTWENGVFPGVRSCTATVRNANGDVVGSSTHDVLESLTPSIEDWVDASEEPAEFEATCGERLDIPVTAVIEDAHLRGSQEIAFSVGLPADFPAGAHPSTNQCIATLTRPGVGGSPPEYIGTKQFNIMLDPRLPYTAALDESTPTDTSGLVPTIVCEPFDGHVDDLVAAYTS